MKKKIIVTGSILAFVGLLILLAFTLFSLKTVTIDFRTSVANIVQTEKEIIESGKFKMGSTTLIHNKKKYIKRIEDFNPYIKVINIETVFPSKFIVHLAERQEVYAVQYESGYYICDEELRILRTDENYLSTQNNAILLSQDGVDVQSDSKIGEYIKNINLPPIYSTMYAQNRPLNEQQALIESINIKTEFDSVVKKDQKVIYLNYFSGQTFKIVNADYGLKYKTKLMNDVYCQLYDFIGKQITDKNGDEIILTEQLLKDCTIIINNYYDYTRYDEDDCFFDLIVNQN